MGMLENLERMLAEGRDDALLRFTLGDLYLKRDDPAAAATHLQAAVEQDPEYSAAWKLYGRALSALNHADEALAAFERGIEVAEARGDKQAAKEMSVFRKRLLKKR